MPHTRAARMRLLKEAAEWGNIQQMPHSDIDMGWNDYLGWDLPELTYQPDALAWYPSRNITIDQTLLFGDIRTPMVPANGLPDIICGKASTTNFYGPQSWDSTSTQDFRSVTPSSVIPPPRSASEYTSYEYPSLEKDNHQAHRRDDGQTWRPKVIRQTSSLSDEVYSRRSSEEPAIKLSQDFDDAPTQDSEVESEQVSVIKIDANKKRKIAHSAVEKKYRTRIMDGMAELKLCLPSTARARSSSDSMRPKRRRAADDATLNYTSGKAAILSDAVQYVRALELQNDALHEQLDIMQRRNHILQKIALSKRQHSTKGLSYDENK